jgi:hypothetical protein
MLINLRSVLHKLVAFQCESLLRSKFERLAINSAVFELIISIGIDLFHIPPDPNDQLLLAHFPSSKSEECDHGIAIFSCQH